jgi:hypothetical protein
MDSFPEYLDIFVPCVGGRYVIGALPYQIQKEQKKKAINQALADYLAMHILSVCVRYKQDFWGSIINGEESGVLGLINLYITVITRRFPNIILDNLTGEAFEYGSPGRLT